MQVRHNFKDNLRVAGLKHTQARQAVLQILKQENRPLDAAEICILLEQMTVATDQATVYRILDVFTKKGIITRFEFQEGKFRYEISGQEHHHLICETCGRIEDFSDCSIADLEIAIRKKKGFSVKRHALEFYGICTACQN